ncbi:hypothetical protein EHS25_005339 [Saitozyma podzolica]|uniref:Uncharacterized protein n=1 Tax=Saitozyma podzolica TaxID=1890683 RepID=A0A427XYX9_9TREE|nr:hypothetical protein EHS25_005339 [Saitozyma podzolica]
MQVVQLDTEDIHLLDTLVEGGKQRRFLTPNWMTDFGFPDWYGPGNADAPDGARLLTGN